MSKCISVVVPTYNEEKNIPLVLERIEKLFKERLMMYDYRILFVDNCSKDNSKAVIRKAAMDNPHIQYIFYVKNFGFSKSVFYGLTQAEGDCAILLFADMQDPPELIVDFVYEWEQGAKVVAGIKNKSQESHIMYSIRQVYYHIMNRITEVDHINQFTGFGLYDRTVIDVFSELDDPLPYLRGIVAELAPECTCVYYEQDKRKYGKSSFKFRNLYDVAMLGITSYSHAFMRLATVLGVIISAISIIIAVITFLLKVFHKVDYPIGNAAILFGVYFMGGVLLLFLGLLGEYIANINVRTMHHPIVVEEERYNIQRKGKQT